MLLKQLLTPETVDGGEIKIGPSTKIGYYAQEQETLDLEQTPLQELRNLIPIGESGAVAFLTRFLRYFLDQSVDRIIHLQDGCVTEFVGGYTDYVETVGQGR